VKVCVTLFDVLAKKLPSPPYTALIVSAGEVYDTAEENVAWPVAKHSASALPPPLSRNVTVPVASVPKLVTVAVNVKYNPNAVITLESVKNVVVVPRVTTCVRLLAELPLKLASPLYTALMV